MRGIVANDAEEAMYMARDKDQNGDSITSKHTYELHFPAGTNSASKVFLVAHCLRPGRQPDAQRL